MKSTTFRTAIKGFGNNTGIEVPIESLQQLGSSKRPPVKVIIGDYTYQSTVAVMSGMYLISLPKVHRDATGLVAGAKITVTLELVEGVREVEIPYELQKALSNNKLTDVFGKLAYSKRKEFARQVNEAKTDKTRERRISKIIEALKN